MPEYEFSLIERPDAAIRLVQAIVDQYNARAINHTFSFYTMSWAESWPQLMRMALYKKGPAFSEIGTSFTGDLVNMNSLRPFAAAEIQHVGGQEAFFPIAWRNGQAPKGQEQWGLPFTLDVRLAWYWRDLIEQAGIDEATAFSTPEHFHETMEKLQAAGMEYPLYTDTTSSRNTVYHLASWLWKRGGEFIDANGHVAFHQPQAVEGILDYFRLFPFINPARPDLFSSFSQRKSAVAIQSPHMLQLLKDSQQIPADLVSRLGVAALPGPSYVGGSNLAIWVHTPYKAEQAASAFITNFLSSEAYLSFIHKAQYLPALHAAARDPRWADPQYQTMFDIVQQGRSHYGSHLWVVLADRMAQMAERTFNELFAVPSISQAEIASLVRSRVEALAARLDYAMR